MTFAELLAAAEAGAASIYHAVIATGEEISAWETSPVTAPLVAAGVAAANSLLTRTGVSAGVIESDVTTALKGIAAADPTIPSAGASISAIVGLAGKTVAAIAPGTAPVVSELEGDVAAAEALAHVIPAA